MLTLKACGSGWTPARDAYNGLANFPVSQTFVREHFCNYCAARNFNRSSCRCTPVTSVNDGASCGFAIFRRVARKWPDQSIQGRLSVQMLRPTDFFLVFRVLLMIQFDLSGLRGSCAASTYSVEDGPNPVI